MFNLSPAELVIFGVLKAGWVFALFGTALFAYIFFRWLQRPPRT
jgi:hypothetical protein